MSNHTEHQTSVFMNNNDVNAEVNSGRRLLSTASREDKRAIPRTRITPSKVSIKAILLVLVILSIAIAIIIIVTITSYATPPIPTLNDNVPSYQIDEKKHMRCEHNLSVGNEDRHWQTFHFRAPVWKSFPEVPQTEFVLISRKYELKLSPGVQVSIQLPHNNSVLYVMAVNGPKHTNPVEIRMKSDQCQLVLLDDPKFFNGTIVHFRIFIFYKNKITMKNAKFAVTSLPPSMRFRDMVYQSKPTTEPKFRHIETGRRDTCTVEISEGAVHECNWWNVEDVDTADFERLEVHDCISGGVPSSESATWFFGIAPTNKVDEARALLVSPIIERNTSSIILTLWYIFKCDGSQLRVHLVPANQPHHKLIQVAQPVATISRPANHTSWKFRSFQITLPEDHGAYQVVLEGIVPRDGNCSEFGCYSDGLITFKEAKSPIIGVDDITLELMHEQCNNTEEPNVMDCKFQDGKDASTTCEWASSEPGVGGDSAYDYYDFSDWKPVNSGFGSDHGATEQHFIGRGYVMWFDATGRVSGSAHVRSPKLEANNNCACVMSFLYLLRGMFSPRLQVNIVYEGPDGSEVSEAQWSLFGHQSENWELATVPINLVRGRPFIIEIRVRDVTESKGDVHFDDMKFTGCDMVKYE